MNFKTFILKFTSKLTLKKIHFKIAIPKKSKKSISKLIPQKIHFKIAISKEHT